MIERGHGGQAVGDPAASDRPAGDRARVHVAPRAVRVRRAGLRGLVLLVLFGSAPAQASADPADAPESAAAPAQAVPEDQTGAEGAPDLDVSDAEAGSVAEGAPAKALTVWLSVGTGATQRAIAFAGADGAGRLETAMVPAIDLQVRGRLSLGTAFVGLSLRYQTSLWADSVQGGQPSAGSASSIRSHRAEGGIVPGVRFGSGEDAVSLSALMGYGVRAFASVVPMRVPSFSLHGPLVRLQVEIPIAGLLCLRLEPEGQLILAGAELSRLASLRGPGIAIGGQASLGLVVQAFLRLEASYRESHIRLDSYGSEALSDVERYLLLGASARFQ